MTTTGTYTTDITRESCGKEYEFEIEVTYDAIPFERGGTDGLYGPKIEPDIPAHIEINSAVIVEDGRDIELTGSEVKLIAGYIAEYLDERDERCDDDELPAPELAVYLQPSDQQIQFPNERKD